MKIQTRFKISRFLDRATIVTFFFLGVALVVDYHFDSPFSPFGGKVSDFIAGSYCFYIAFRRMGLIK